MPDFFIGNMIPTCISDDVEAAKAVNRKTLTHYALLPNYRNYWKEAGYVEEMEAIETAIAEKRKADVPKYLTDAWLADCTLFGPAARVREGLEAWYAAGIRTPIIVPSSARRQPDEGDRGNVRHLHGLTVPLQQPPPHSNVMPRAGGHPRQIIEADDCASNGFA